MPDHTPKREAADGPGVASRTSLNLPERMNELSDGVIGPFNATREGRRWVHIGNPGLQQRSHERWREGLRVRGPESSAQGTRGWGRLVEATPLLTQGER